MINAPEVDVDDGPDPELDELLARASGGQDSTNQNAGSNEPYELLDDLPPNPSLFENESEKSDSDEEPEVIYNENERPRRGTGW